MKPQLARALANDEDEQVKRWSAVALVRLGDVDARAAAEPALHGTAAPLRIAAAVAFAEQGDARGEVEIIARFKAAFVPDSPAPGDLEEGRELLGALTKIKSTNPALPFGLALDDVRLRPYAAEAIGQIGDPRWQGLLLTTFANERYVDVRPKEARALLQLGVREGLAAPLRRFAGLPDPMLDAVVIARDAGLLEVAQGGWKLGPTTAPSSSHVDVEVTVGGTGPARLLAIGLGEGPSGQIDGQAINPVLHGSVWIVELPVVGARAHVALDDVAAFWIVGRAPELLPPPPERWAPEGGL